MPRLGKFQKRSSYPNNYESSKEHKWSSHFTLTRDVLELQATEDGLHCLCKIAFSFFSNVFTCRSPLALLAEVPQPSHRAAQQNFTSGAVALVQNKALRSLQCLLQLFQGEVLQGSLHVMPIALNPVDMRLQLIDPLHFQYWGRVVS